MLVTRIAIERHLLCRKHRSTVGTGLSDMHYIYDTVHLHIPLAY